MSDERTEAELKMTMEVLHPLVLDLRKRGYDAQLWTTSHSDGRYTAEIRVNVPPGGVPVEAV